MHNLLIIQYCFITKIYFSTRYTVGFPRNSVDTEFCWHRISSTRNYVDTEFPRRHGIPPSTRNSLVDTEFPRRHGIPPSTRNSPVDTEFGRHGIRSTRNSVDTEFRRHGILSTWNSVDTEFRRREIPPTRNSADTDVCFFFYFRIFSMLCYAIYFRFIHGIPWNSADLKSESLFSFHTRNSLEFRRFKEPVSTYVWN
jgi:hypothetical protein